MTTTALIASPSGRAAPAAVRRAASHLHGSGGSIAGLPPLLSVVPEAGPPVFAYLGFGLVLLLLLVPPFALLATLMAVALVVVAALTALVALAAAIVEAPFLLVRLVRDHRPRHLSLSAPHVGELKVRRV